ncbi:unnamed protein product [Clavelina lepadiformis]|uniref:Uncharacterized protein n=1 Tax=Clavelina lepadiformis TaxID=159417 RepID=A0ABP0GZ60_CLALP
MHEVPMCQKEKNDCQANKRKTNDKNAKTHRYSYRRQVNYIDHQELAALKRQLASLTAGTFRHLRQNDLKVVHAITYVKGVNCHHKIHDGGDPSFNCIVERCSDELNNRCGDFSAYVEPTEPD